MKRLFLAMWVILAFGWAGQRVEAQLPPTTSPYLNLARPGATALDYYTLVRPTFAFRNSIQQIQSSSSKKQNNSDFQVGPGDLPVTGHQAGFQTHRAYFGTTGSQGQVQPPGSQGQVQPRGQGQSGIPNPGRRFGPR